MGTPYFVDHQVETDARVDRHHNLSSPKQVSPRAPISRRKACDYCHEYKRRCERSGPGELCKQCIALGIPCTFLRPSRNRGRRTKDSLEAGLHEMEALLGIILASSDSRAQSLLRDMGKDPLAKKIIMRVDNSLYGATGRKREDVALGTVGEICSVDSSKTSLLGQGKREGSPIDLRLSTHVTYEWQDRVSKMLNAVVSSSSNHPADNRGPHTPISHASDENLSSGGRRRGRRIGDDDYYLLQQRGNAYPNSASEASASLHQQQLPLDTTVRDRFRRIISHPMRGGDAQSGGRKSSSVEENIMTSDNKEKIMGSVGQVSLNKGEASSGLDLLGYEERIDRSNESVIWPLPSSSTILSGDDELASQLPPTHVQEYLLDLYFRYVQDVFPIIHKSSFLESYRSFTNAESWTTPQTPLADADVTNTSPFNKERRRIPSVLLLAMFALASRYDVINTKPPNPSVRWSAGDEYLDRAKIMLNRTYVDSSPSICQALLLMGYREIGMRAMTQASTYIAMGIRMAQDLGMHHSSDGCAVVGLGGKLFSEWELNERKRIWNGCVVMDIYASTYIGRPLMIFEWGFDTPLSNDDEAEEFEAWTLETPYGDQSPSLPARSISCFNASASLSGILGSIVQSVYSITPLSSRDTELAVLKCLLDKWYLNLPDHLRYEPSSTKVPMPNVMNLHMQYWCAVLLLHLPSIRHLIQSKQKHWQSEASEDPDMRAITAKSCKLCKAAANHITTIVSRYQEKYLITRCPVSVCYYVFIASIMHDTTLTVHPNDLQARLGLSQCMNTLRAITIIWPSAATAARAVDLLGSARADAFVGLDLISPTRITEQNRRTAENALDDHTFTQAVKQQLPAEYGRPHQRTIQHQTSTSSFTHDHSNSAFAGGGDAVYLPPPTATSPWVHPTVNMRATADYTWQPNEMNPHPYNTSLSTAVLPLPFSNRLVDNGIYDQHLRVQGSPTYLTEQCNTYSDQVNNKQ